MGSVRGTTYDQQELAWAAGFFDGEGYTGSSVPRDRADRAPRLTLAVGQREPTTLSRSQRAVGGIGTVYQYPRNGKPSWCWHAQSFEQAQAAIALHWRWLSGPKRRQAKAAVIAYHAGRIGRRPVRPKGRGNSHTRSDWRRREDRA